MHSCSVSPQSLGLDISTLLILHYCRILKSPSCQDVDATWTLSQRKLRAEYTNLNALPAYTYHLFASRYQIPGLLWTLETHGLSGIPVRHKPAKIQRQQSESQRTLHYTSKKDHSPHLKTTITVVSKDSCK